MIKVCGGIAALIFLSACSTTTYSPPSPTALDRNPAVEAPQLPDRLPDDRHASTHRAYIGISVTTCERKDRTEVAVISDFQRHSEAINAGLLRGDEIVSIAGKNVNSGKDVAETLALFPPTNLAYFVIIRNGKTRPFIVPTVAHEFNGPPVSASIECKNSSIQALAREIKMCASLGFRHAQHLSELQKGCGAFLNK